MHGPARGAVWLPTWAIGTLGLIVILFQDVFGLLGRATPASWHSIWEFLYPVGAEVKLGQNGPSIAVLYTIVPWIGVMAAGYAFGAIMVREPAERRRLCLRIGAVRDGAVPDRSPVSRCSWVARPTMDRRRSSSS